MRLLAAEFPFNCAPIGSQKLILKRASWQLRKVYCAYLQHTRPKPGQGLFLYTFELSPRRLPCRWTSAARQLSRRSSSLTSLLDTFEQNGWETFRDFAFSVPHNAKDEHFEEQVVPVLLKLDTPEGRKLLPRLRQLYAQAYTVAAESMKQFSSQEGVNQKIHMVPAERAERVKKMRDSISGFETKGPNMPSTGLSDRMVTILTTAFAKYVAWEMHFHGAGDAARA